MIHAIWKIILQLRNPSCTIRTSRIGRNVNLSKNVHIGYGSIVAADRIGKHTFINDYCLIDKNVSSIGNFCSIAYNSRIGLGDHPTDWVSSHPFAYLSKYKFRNNNISYREQAKPKTIIGNDVWIGANATILAGVQVGDGAIIGAHSLVTKNVEPYSIVLGTPARHLRYRFSENIIAELNNLQWWDWEDEKIKATIDLFSDPEKLINKIKDD